jgi:hypothetical protein
MADGSAEYLVTSPDEFTVRLVREQNESIKGLMLSIVNERLSAIGKPDSSSDLLRVLIPTKTHIVTGERLSRSMIRTLDQLRPVINQVPLPLWTSPHDDAKDEGQAKPRSQHPDVFELGHTKRFPQGARHGVLFRFRNHEILLKVAEFIG